LWFGLASTAQWLTHACGIAQRTAVEHVRVAGSLAQFPQLAAEMGAGRLSFSQVRAISRTATPGEHGLVADLVEAARHATVAQLEVVVRGLRTVDHNEPATDPGESLTQSWTSDSRWQLSARLDPERGAVVALEAIVQRDGCTPAEALERLAQICLASLADAGDPPRDRRGDEHAAVVIHLDAARVRPRSAEPDPGDVSSVARPYARVAGGPGLPDRVIQRLLCDGRIRTVIHDRGSNMLDVGRSHRLVTDRQYRALLLRHHGHCAHPGCPNAKNLHAHHRIHWIHGGRTDLDNLLLLCERHHLAHHGGEFELFTLGAGRFRFVTSDGRDLSAPLRSTASPNTPPLEDEHAQVAADAATPRWDGQRLDRPYAISVLAQRRQAAS
ncbi:MAG TPA: HNH endonuclease signature motif containing protein, partial [Acidothermaceae bacterium]